VIEYLRVFEHVGFFLALGDPGLSGLPVYEPHRRFWWRNDEQTGDAVSVGRAAPAGDAVTSWEGL